MNHPNTFAAALTSAATTVAIWLSKRYFHYDLSLPSAMVIVGAATSAVLFIGRRGIKGTLLALWRGSGSIWNGTARAKG